MSRSLLSSIATISHPSLAPSALLPSPFGLQDVMNARARAQAEGWKLDPDDAKSCQAFAAAHPDQVVYYQAQDIPNKKVSTAGGYLIEVTGGSMLGTARFMH